MAEHWLRRQETIRRLWVIFIAILAATVGADLFLERHDLFGIDGSFAFYAWYGFVACIGLILGSKLLGLLFKRSDTYYGD
jgi:hypothetical protein